MIKINEKRALVFLGAEDIQIGSGEVPNSKTKVFVLKSKNGNTIEFYFNDTSSITAMIDELTDLVNSKKD